MKLQVTKGTTSKLLTLFIQDSSSATGAGLPGLTNASSGLTAYYYREGAASATSISVVSMTVGTFTSGGFKEIDSANMPGFYNFCPPDAALASGANSVSILLKGAANMAPLPLEIQLQDSDVYGADTPVMTRGTASAGASTSITLVSPAVATTGYYVGSLIKIFAGTGAGQTRAITAYTSGRVATVDNAWTTNPDSTSQYAVFAFGFVVLQAGTHTGAVIPTVTTLTDLTTTTFAEPSAVPAATATLKDKLGWLAFLARNKINQSATAQTVRNDGDSSDIATAAVADSGSVFTRGKFT